MRVVTTKLYQRDPACSSAADHRALLHAVVLFSASIFWQLWSGAETVKVPQIPMKWLSVTNRARSHKYCPAKVQLFKEGTNVWHRKTKLKQIKVNWHQMLVNVESSSIHECELRAWVILWVYLKLSCVVNYRLVFVVSRIFFFFFLPQI